MTPLRPDSGRPFSFRGMGTVSVPGTRAGLFVSIGLAVVAWLAIPLARPFIVCAVVFGLLTGWILWRKHKG